VNTDNRQKAAFGDGTTYKMRKRRIGGAGDLDGCQLLQQAGVARQPRLADGAPGCAQPVQIVAGLDEQVADHPGNDRAVHLRYDGEPVKVRGQRDRERELSCIVVRLVRGQYNPRYFKYGQLC
jgi:hypothetical protein